MSDENYFYVNRLGNTFIYQIFSNVSQCIFYYKKRLISQISLKEIMTSRIFSIGKKVMCVHLHDVCVVL